MFHPIGPQAPSVYWRRRLVVFGSVVLVLVLVVLTARAALSSDGKTPTAGAGSSPNRPSTTQTTVTSPVSHTHSRTDPPSHPASSPHTSATTSTSGSTAPPTTCTPSQLKVAAATSAPTYAVGAQPQLMIQVTNSGPKPCVQNLADKQIVLKVYNGASRVWGSHDCEVQPGVSNRTLVVNQPVRVSVTWTGLSSQPKCAGTRQRVGAGTYTLYASLSGHTGTAAQFAIH
jgi:hypothetical protein